MASTIIIYSKGDAFGDGLLRIPALRAARTAFPGDRIVYGSTKGSSLTGPLNTHVDHLLDEIRVETPLAPIVNDERLRGERVMIADLRSSALDVFASRAKLMGGVVRYEANLPGYGLAFLRDGRLATRPEHNAWRFHRLIERLAGKPLPFDHRLDVSAEARKLARNIRRSEQPLILICGNHFGHKAMSEEQVAATASALIADGFQVLYLESPGAGPSPAQLAQREPRMTIVGPGLGFPPAKLDEIFLALGEMAEAYIGMEGGMAHLLATVMTPIVLLNAAVNIDRWRPLSNIIEVVEARGRIADIPAKAIVDAAQRLVDARRRDHASRRG